MKCCNVFMLALMVAFSANSFAGQNAEATASQDAISQALTLPANLTNKADDEGTCVPGSNEWSAPFCIDYVDVDTCVGFGCQWI